MPAIRKLLDENQCEELPAILKPKERVATCTGQYNIGPNQDGTHRVVTHWTFIEKVAVKETKRVVHGEARGLSWNACPNDRCSLKKALQHMFENAGGLSADGSATAG